MAIGVDSDQYQHRRPGAKDVIMTSMLKRVDIAVFDFVKTSATDTFTAGPRSSTSSRRRRLLRPSGGHVDDIKAKLDDYKQQIIAGTITVPTTAA